MTAKKSKIQPEDFAENLFIAGKLDEMADLLEKQDASVFRVRAYRGAATYIASLDRPIRAIYGADGRRGLESLPTTGTLIAVAIVELLDSGGLVSLDRLRGSTNPEKLLQTIPMIGPKLAHLIHDRLHIDTLEGLEAAAIDGSLANINGFGKCRINSIRHSLNDMLAGRRPIHSNRALTAPSVTDVLAVDQEYR